MVKARRPAVVQRRSRDRSALLIALGLVVLTVVAYAPVWRFDFVAIDDPQYVSQNPHVTSGLSAANLAWAFTTGTEANWHPLTWISHQLDVALFGMSPGAHHAINLTIHVASTLVLFGVLRRMTGSSGPSAFVAALFAVHPLHVESVAWVAERKDVLSTLFFMLALWAYSDYVRQPGWKRYATVTALFVLGLLTKPMLVTLPFVLLLLDWWPLQRISAATGRAVVMEKLPWIGLAAGSSLVTFIVQQRGGAVRTMETFPMGLRVANALSSYANYLRDTVWPAGLGIFYPFPAVLNMTAVIASVVMLTAISAFAVMMRRRAPYVLVGWLWYLGMLVPVIGLVQVGTQARADRYSYVPLAGIFIAVAWGVIALMARWPALRRAVPAAAAIIVLGFGVVTNAQVQHWRDTVALWSHTADVTEDTNNNFGVHYALGEYYREHGQLAEAITQYDLAIARNPRYVESYWGLGRALSGAGQVGRAIGTFRDLTRLKPDHVEAHAALAVLLNQMQKTDEAIAEYSEVVRLRPDVGEGHHQLGLALARSGRIGEALPHLAEAVRLDPQLPASRNDYGLALSESGHRDEARAQYEEALRLNPNQPESHNNLGSLLAAEGKFADAAREFEASVRVAPDYIQGRMNLALAYYRLNKVDDALREFREVLKLEPNNQQAMSAIAALVRK